MGTAGCSRYLMSPLRKRNEMIRVYPDLKALSQAAAEMFADLADQSIARHGRFCAALSGGQTPELTYTLLAAPPFRERIRWQAVHIFWGDERCVPADDPRSNTLMVRKALLEHVPVPPAQIHPIACDLPPKEAAEKYESELHDFFCEQAPSFDLVLLGTRSKCPYCLPLSAYTRAGRKSTLGV